NELRKYLGERVPEYMIPAAFVVLDALPLTPNGKLDRRALPAPEREHRGRERGYVAARTAEEEIVAGIWVQVLGLGRGGINDNFFELGGHSLFDTQVMSRVRETFQTDIPLKVLFERPTVEELVESIGEARTAGTGQRPQAIARASREGELPLSFAQQRLWFI